MLRTQCEAVGVLWWTLQFTPTTLRRGAPEAMAEGAKFEAPTQAPL